MIKTMDDATYQKTRNDFIPYAEVFANLTVGTNKKIFNYNEKWTRCFFKKMDDLWEDFKNSSQEKLSWK